MNSGRRRPSHNPSHTPRRFTRQSNLREEVTGKLIQVVLGTLLFGALVTLCFKAVQMVRVHFLTKYGTQAWALPVGIGLISLFVLFNLYRTSAALTTRIQEMRESAEASDNKEDN